VQRVGTAVADPAGLEVVRAEAGGAVQVAVFGSGLEVVTLAGAQ
jgi:hypothetical protein